MDLHSELFITCTSGVKNIWQMHDVYGVKDYKIVKRPR